MFAQSGIFGVVKDEDTGEALVGAAIYNDSLQIGTVTDFNGYYDLKLQPGVYTIRYSYLGFTTVEKFVVVDNSRKLHTPHPMLAIMMTVPLNTACFREHPMICMR